MSTSTKFEYYVLRPVACVFLLIVAASAIFIILLFYWLMISTPYYLWREIYYEEPQRVLAREQYFNEHFASLPEVQQLFNISMLSSNVALFTEDKALDAFVKDADSSSVPQTLLQLTTALVLQLIEKQNVLEAEIKRLQSMEKDIKDLTGMEAAITDFTTMCYFVALVVFVYVAIYRRNV